MQTKKRPHKRTQKIFFQKSLDKIKNTVILWRSRKQSGKKIGKEERYEKKKGKKKEAL